MKLAVSTLLVALLGLTSAAPSPVNEPQTPSTLEDRQNPNWYGVRDVARIAIDQLRGLDTTLNNLRNEVDTTWNDGAKAVMRSVLNNRDSMIHGLNTLITGAENEIR